MNKNDKKLITPGGVDEYIAQSPVSVRHKLEQIRTTIHTVAPGSVETISYFHIPGYSYEGYDYNGMFTWFSFKEPYIRLHVRPPVIKDHLNELTNYPTTASIISFPIEEGIPEKLVAKMVKASLSVMRSDSL